MRFGRVDVTSCKFYVKICIKLMYGYSEDILNKYMQQKVELTWMYRICNRDGVR